MRGERNTYQGIGSETMKGKQLMGRGGEVVIEPVILWALGVCHPWGTQKASLGQLSSKGKGAQIFKYELL